MKILIAAAVALTAIATTPAGAQTALETKVFYGDLDIDGTAGMSTLKLRIERTAHTLCNDRAGNVELATRAASLRCYIAAVAGAMKQVPVTAPQYASR